jgi:hypothetical protein
MNIGNGWQLKHITDRTILLTKDSYEYRRFVGRDGYVLQRAEPGMNKADLIAKAVERARQTDDILSRRVARRILPRFVERFQAQQASFATAFGIPGEEPSEKVYRP